MGPNVDTLQECVCVCVYVCVCVFVRARACVCEMSILEVFPDIRPNALEVRNCVFYIPWFCLLFTDNNF